MYHVYHGGTFLRKAGKIFPTTQSKNPEVLVGNNLAVEISNVSRNVNQVLRRPTIPGADNCQSKDAVVGRVCLLQHSEVGFFG
jgi:hypothetical protein